MGYKYFLEVLEAERSSENLLCYRTVQVFQVRPPPLPAHPIRLLAGSTSVSEALVRRGETVQRKTGSERCGFCLFVLPFCSCLCLGCPCFP